MKWLFFYTVCPFGSTGLEDPPRLPECLDYQRKVVEESYSSEVVLWVLGWLLRPKPAPEKADYYRFTCHLTPTINLNFFYGEIVKFSIVEDQQFRNF